MKRRDFFRVSLAASALTLSSSSLATTVQPNNKRQVSEPAFFEKRPLIIYSDRPPLLETPRDAFTRSITPNDEFFVRWHMPNIPTHIDMNTYYIHVHGDVKNRLYLTVDMLKKDFEQVELTAVLQCGGNSRSAFNPITSGIQWGSGAMGCASFKGVRLKDVLAHAGLEDGATWISLNGDDKAVMKKIQSFKRSLKIDEISDDTIIAYEMNGEELPFLNGYPVRLIIPGVYSDSWVKMLSDITVTKEYKECYYMDKAYRVPDNETESETPDNLASKTKPLDQMNVKSYIGYPTSYSKIHLNIPFTIKGVAFDSGHGIKEVLISLDEGVSWQKSTLENELSPYAFRVFKYKVKPLRKGKLTIMAKAINNRGEVQPFAKDIQWNHGGYRFNGIDTLRVDIV